MDDFTYWWVGVSIATFACRTFLLDGHPSSLQNRINRRGGAVTDALYDADVCDVARQ